MTPTRDPRPTARLGVLLAAVVAAFIVLLVGVGPAGVAAGTAPGQSFSADGTGVGAHRLADQVLVEGPDGITAGQRRDNGVVAAVMAVGSRVAPNTLGTASRIHRHHTVPSEILRQLPDDVANHPLVRGRAGAPNRWPIPEDVHRSIHSGAGGGAYNQAWKDALDSLGRSPTVDDVLRLRGQITKQFGIDVYRPYQ